MNEEKIIQRSIEVRLGVQKALLGLISAQFRAVYCGWSETGLSLYFIMDGPIQDHDNKDIQAIKARLESLFPGNSVDTQAMQVDYPQKRPIFENAHLVYLRKENKV